MFPSRRIATSGGDVFRNEYSLEFDSSNDYIATSGDGTLADGTYVFWAKSTETGSNYGVFGHGGDATGAFHINVGGAPYLAMRQTGGNTRRFWTDIPAQDDGNWHHWAVYIDGSSITDSKLYVDGVLQTVTTTNDSGNITAYSSLTIGSSTNSYFGGSLDEFAHWNIELSANQIKTLFNNRESFNAKNIALSNLKGYWRMGDGVLDDGNIDGSGLIADQVTPTIGSELWDTPASIFTSGTYAWTVYGTNTIENDSNSLKITYDNDARGAYVWLKDASDLSSDLTIGQLYKLTFDAKVDSGNSVDVTISTMGSAPVTVTATDFTSGTIYFIAANTNSTYIDTRNMAGGEIIWLDNISLKPVNGNGGLMTSMTASDIESDVPS